MATLLQSQSLPSYPMHHGHNPPAGKGILLLSTPPLSYPKRNSNTPSNNSLSSSASASESNSSASSSLSFHNALADHHQHNPHSSKPRSGSGSNPSTRRIRFAPLPDPRRDLLITDDGIEIHVPVEADFMDPEAASLADRGRSATPCFQDKDNNHSNTRPHTPTSLLTPDSSSDLERFKSIDSESGTCSTITATAKRRSSNKPKSRSKWTAKLTPFLKTSSSPPSDQFTESEPSTPISTASTFSRINFSTEEILTLGTINLFRATSAKDHRRNSSNDSDSGGWSLSRWTSGGNGKDKDRGRDRERDSLALTRTSSRSHRDDSGTSNGRSTSLPPEKRKQSSSVNANGFSTGSVRTGTRMLNGRVYGGRRNTAANGNPFATARDTEPEFVEWGYGGMGSVKNSKGGGGGSAVDWRKLQSGESFGSGKAGAGAQGKDNDDGDVDDGSGMTWVKKRREQREREKREREEKERAQQEQESASDTLKPIIEGVPVTSSADVASAIPIESQTSDLPSTSIPPPITPESPPIPPITRSATHPLTSTSDFIAPPLARSSSQPIRNPEDEGEHILTAINIPAPKPAHGHHHSHSRHHSRVSLSTLSLLSAATGASASVAGETTVTEEDGEFGQMEMEMTAPAAEKVDVEEAASKSEREEAAILDEPEASGRKEPQEKEEIVASANVSVMGSGSSSGGSNSSDDEDEDEDEREPDADEDEDEDEDEDAETEERKTALGAGVEKISRHKEKSNEKAQEIET